MAQNFLHNLPHIDHSFNKVSNEIIIPESVEAIFAWNTNSYQQSIQMFAYIPVAIGIIYAQICMIVMITYCCFGRCKYMFSYGKSSNSNENEQYKYLNLLFHHNQNEELNENIQLTKCSKFIRWAFALLVFISLIFAIVYGTSFNESIIKIADDWTDSYNDYETIIDDAMQVNDHYIPDAQLQCKLILNTSSAEDIWDNITALNNTLTIYSSLISDFLGSAENVPSWNVVNDKIKPYREFSIIFPVIALIVYGLLMILNYICYSHDYLSKKTCCYCFSFLIIYLGLFIFIITCIQFAVSVQIADGCNDPNHSMWQAVDAYNDDPTTREIIKYYIYCIDNNTITNPLYTEFNESYSQLISLNDTVYQLVNISEIYGIVPQANNLSIDYHESLSLMNEINETIQCETIDTYKQNMINELCGNGLNYWSIYYSFQCGFIMLLAIRSWMISTQNRSKSKSKNLIARNNKNNYGTNLIDAGSIDEDESAVELGDRDKNIGSSLIETETESDIEGNNDENNWNNNILINIKQGKDQITQYNVNRNKTVYDLMEMIEDKQDIDTAQQKLIYNGNQVQPDKIIGDTVKNGATIYLIILDLTLSTEYEKYAPENANDLNLPQ